MTGNSHIKVSCNIVQNTGSYCALHINHEVQLAIESGDLSDPKYLEYVKIKQAEVDKLVMKHQIDVREKLLKLLDAEKK